MTALKFSKGDLENKKIVSFLIKRMSLYCHSKSCSLLGNQKHQNVAGFGVTNQGCFCKVLCCIFAFLSKKCKKIAVILHRHEKFFTIVDTEKSAK